jgi:hypothetical protein
MIEATRVENMPIEALYSHPVVQELLKKIDGDLENIKLPYIMKDKILMSPGVWNGYFYASNAIKDAFLSSDWNKKEIRSLFLDHEDLKSAEWIGEVVNAKLDGDSIIGDLVIVDKPTAMKLAYGAKMGISPKVSGQEDDGKMVQFKFDNFSVVINPAVKTAYINNSQKAEIKIEEVKKMAENVDQVELAATEGAGTAVGTAKKEIFPSKPFTAPGGVPVKMSELSDDNTLELLAQMDCVLAGNVGDLAKKAKEIRAKDPKMSWQDAIKEASKMAEVVVDAPIEVDAEKKKYPYPMSDDQILSQAVEILQKKKGKAPEGEPWVPVEEKAAEKKVKCMENSETVTMTQTVNQQAKVIQELSEKLQAMENRFNEPDKATIKVEMSQSISDNPDVAFMDMLRAY